MRFMYESILLEDIDAVKKVFMNRFTDMSEEEFDGIIKLDPTYNENRDSVGKYGKWLLGLYKKDNPLNYNTEDIYNILDMYNDYKNDSAKDIEKDINKFKSIADLYDAVNNVENAELSDRQKERKLRKAYQDAKLLFSDNKWEVWTPESYAASCTLGKGTRWCTAYSENDSYYNDYTRQGPLYVFINKQNPKEKYQLHVETNSFMDEDDESTRLEDVLATDDKLREFVYNEIYDYKIDKDGNFIYDGNNRVPEAATSIIIKQGVTSISERAFHFCESLQSIIIPDSVTSIGTGAFWQCKSLQSIIIPDSVTSIGDYAFDECKSLQLVTISDSVTNIGVYTFAHCESLQSVTIPNSVTKIDGGAFYGCKSLKSVTIPDSVTEIISGAFENCESLQSVIIPNSVTKIGMSAFAHCESLQSVTIPDSVIGISDHAFDGCESLQSVTIPNSVEYIGYYAFNNCKSLKSINIPNSVTTIASGVFSDCKSLQSVTIPNSVTKIVQGAFEGCISLQSVIIPNSVISIGDDAFYYCKSLPSVTMPNSVISIGYYAFDECDNLKEVTLENPNTRYEKNTFPEHTKIIKKGVNESLKANINEAIKINDTLNPKLWDLTTNELLPDVKNQLMSVVEVFENYIDIPLSIVDIQLVGSNASFNYTNTSDIDLHIIANFELTSTDTAILQALCDAKKTSFNKTYDIRIKGLEVEVYVQDINAGIISNGIYSLCLDEWVKFPVLITNVTEHDNTIALKKWTDRINQVITTNNKSEIEDAINILYLIRHNSIAIDGEYGAGNQLFKDIRSAGLLQQLKDALVKSTSDELSLEGFTPGQIVNRLR